MCLFETKNSNPFFFTSIPGLTLLGQCMHDAFLCSWAAQYVIACVNWNGFQFSYMKWEGVHESVVLNIFLDHNG